MSLIEQKQWIYLRDRDAADLFYYALTFQNFEMVYACAQKWKERYGEINSLFFYNCIHPQTKTTLPRLIGLYVLNHPRAFDKINEDFLLKMKGLGLILFNSEDLITISLKKLNIPLFDFLYKERSCDIKNGKSLMTNFIRSSSFKACFIIKITKTGNATFP